MGPLAERTGRLLILVKLPPKPASAPNVLQGFGDKLLGIAAPRCLAMTQTQAGRWRGTRNWPKNRRGGVFATRTAPSTWCASTCPRALICPSTGRCASVLNLPIGHQHINDAQLGAAGGLQQRSTVQKDHAPENMAIVRHVVLNMLNIAKKQAGESQSAFYFETKFLTGQAGERGEGALTAA